MTYETPAAFRMALEQRLLSRSTAKVERADVLLTAPEHERK